MVGQIVLVFVSLVFAWIGVRALGFFMSCIEDYVEKGGKDIE